MKRRTLIEDGFVGFRPFAELELSEVPQSPGIYAVLVPDEYEPHFLKDSVGG
ncbi:hypothetical protein [Arthrobacter sp. 24S4-2]|uniref:hypothetical protein n=1 Tax=Arthrobacter sp. 24S4-2 TaxID=2575374 RepID=UPI0015860206|nr:hypothetical protein [Arthrobacter sp. 24S4-2]